MVDRYSSLSSKESEKSDCLGCRLSGGLVFIGIGCYLASLGRRMRNSEKYGYYLLSSGAVVFGTGYLFNLNPLSHTKK